MRASEVIFRTLAKERHRSETGLGLRLKRKPFPHPQSEAPWSKHFRVNPGLDFSKSFIEKTTFRHKASSDLMRGQQEWRDRNKERKGWNLAKFQVVQRREKIGRVGRKREVTGLEETEKESIKKKNRPEKTEETGSASTGERQHQQFSQQERHTWSEQLETWGAGRMKQGYRFSVGERQHQHSFSTGAP